MEQQNGCKGFGCQRLSGFINCHFSYCHELEIKFALSTVKQDEHQQLDNAFRTKTFKGDRETTFMKKSLLLIILLVIPLVQAEEWQSYESEHFIFYYQRGHLTLDELAVIAENEEALFSRITTYLQIEYTGKIEYYLYGNRKDFEGIPGAYAIGNEVRFLCIFCVDFCKSGLNDAHEMTHALANQIGFQHGLLAEGLAVHIEDYLINDVNLHGIVKILYTENRLTPLDDLVEDFWCDILYNYDIAGSFATYLIEEYGIEQFKELYSKPPGFFPFLEVYNKSLEELEAEWIAVVKKAEITENEEKVVKYRDGIKEGLAIYFDLGFGTLEHATYPAKAEEGICLFREENQQDFEKAFLHLDQFNQGMKAWEEAIETFEDALIGGDTETRLELFRKSNDLYKIAGDEEMITLSGEYVSALESLVEIRVYLQEGDLTRAEEEFERVTPVLQELGEEEELNVIAQDFQILKEQNIQELETGAAVLFLFVCAVIAGIVIRKIR